MRAMRIELMSDVELFAARAEDFLAAQVERNVLATVLVQARRGRFQGHGSLFACCLDEREQLQAVAMRTPPWPLLACDFQADTAELLLERWLPEDPSVPGVNARAHTARVIAAAWSKHTERPSHCSLHEAMHLLSEVNDPPQPAHGRLRIAAAKERELLTAWEQAFVLEAGTGVIEEAGRSVSARLASGAQHVWEDDGAVCTLALSPAIAGTVRIGPVYTPPEHRRRGYASSAVAAACRHAFAHGARQCMLFTDLANPTSNKIYADVGFQRFAEWEEHRFSIGPAPPDQACAT
jgi:predicted GNAT family acetyltransferase